ncbi:hypothetical protein FBU30_001492 [Linnemannia zychae]|nr:hypothetical protein FBU30_001492 [Linnemannia zychae]
MIALSVRGGIDTHDVVCIDGHGVSLPMEFPDSVQATSMSYNIQSTPLNNIVIPDTTTIRDLGKNDLSWRRSVSDLYEWIGLASLQSDRISIAIGYYIDSIKARMGKYDGMGIPRFAYILE